MHQFLSLREQGKDASFALQGDALLFCAACRKLLWAYAGTHVPRGEQQDFVERGLLRVVRGVRKFTSGPSDRSMCALVFTLARREAADSARRERRRAERGANSAGAETHLDPHLDTDPLLEAVRHERRDAVHLALKQLKLLVRPIDYNLLILLEMESKSIDEVAQELDLTPAQVRDRRRRMRAKLKPILQRILGRDNQTNE